MKKEELKEIIGRISDARIAIIGDFCLDAYWFVNDEASEISIETGEPTRPVSEQKYSLGGAGNVANNLAAMEVKEIKVFGVTGPDPFGNKMAEIMTLTGINATNLITQQNDWATHVYIKPYIGEKELSRIDFGNFNILKKETADELIERLRKNLDDIDIVIINQQVPSGIHTPYFRNRLVNLIRVNKGKTFIADSRNFSDEFDGAIRKINDTEAARLCGIQSEPNGNVSEKLIWKIAGDLYKRYERPVFITRGSRGSLTVDESGISIIPGLLILSKVDTVGAGDSYLAGAAAALASGYPVKTAAMLGSFVAGVTVQKLFQTGTATPGEILEIGSDPDLLYNQNLAEDISEARYYEGTGIEIINRHSGSKIRYAIFDNDGTISTLREGWERLMAPVMVKSILGEKYAEADEATLRNINTRVSDLIDKTTGIQTLMQMRYLIDVIREYGFVPENKILDEAGYKEIYNQELLQMVRQREDRLRSGELTVDDYSIRNSIPFLKILHSRGIKMYLASGTDEADVKHEAAVLGYDIFFGDRIFGSVGDINKDAKKIVLDKILDLIGSSESSSIITFGDGPVEIRETHKRGGITVGVASDEVSRQGLNESKRTRIIKAGADFVIPDFSQSEHLLQLLNI